MNNINLILDDLKMRIGELSVENAILRAQLEEALRINRESNLSNVQKEDPNPRR